MKHGWPGGVGSRPVLAAVASAILLWDATVLAHGLAGDQSAENSVKAVTQTLQNLLLSIEDEGRAADALNARRQRWCDDALRARAVVAVAHNASLAKRQGDLTRYESNAATVGAELKRLQASSESAGSQTSAGSEDQLQATTLRLALLQANASEARRRISDEQDAAEAWAAFDDALADNCAKGATRARTQAARRLNSDDAVAGALRALRVGQLDAATGGDTINLVQKGRRHRLVQRGPYTSKLEHDEAMMAKAADAADEASPSASASRSVEASSRSSASPAIRGLLAQLRDKKDADAARRRQWCTEEVARNAQVQKAARSDASLTATAVKEHADAQARLERDLDQFRKELAGLNNTVSEVQDAALREGSLRSGAEKDRRLALKILEEAGKVLMEVEGRAALPVGLGKGAAAAAVQLKSAHQAFLAQLTTADDAQQEASQTAEAVRTTAEDVAKAIEQQRADIELVRDTHASERAKLVEQQQAQDSEAQEASGYLKDIGVECGDGGFTDAQGQGEEQIHALEDAQRALNGTLGAPATKASVARNLTPMERAAEEMQGALAADN